MLHATSSLMEGLEQWLRALEANDFPAAREFAKHFTMHGELLALHPDFARCFKEHANGLDPHEGLFILRQFLLCATQGREHVIVKRSPSS